MAVWELSDKATSSASLLFSSAKCNVILAPFFCFVVSLSPPFPRCNTHLHCTPAHLAKKVTAPVVGSILVRSVWTKATV